MKAPTGDDNETDSFGTLPASVQTGSGSWDIFGGIVATYARIDWQVDTQISYQKNNEANGIQMGDIVRADASFQYRLLPRALTSSTSGFLYGVVEANLIHKNETSVDGIDDPDSGGATLFAVPAIQYATKRWIAELAVQLPVIQSLNGTALENDYIVRTGFRVNF